MISFTMLRSILYCVNATFKEISKLPLLTVIASSQAKIDENFAKTQSYKQVLSSAKMYMKRDTEKYK